MCAGGIPSFLTARNQELVAAILDRIGLAPSIEVGMVPRFHVGCGGGADAAGAVETVRHQCRGFRARPFAVE